MLSLLTNISSAVSQSYLDVSNRELSVSLSRLSSGLRVRSAADDAAGLAISEDFKAKIRSLEQARRNANDAVSLAQVADGSLKEVQSLLGRMRELSIQARNGTVNTQQRGYLNDEFKQLRDEIDRISKSTEFNGVKIIDGSQSKGIVFQVGAMTSINDRLTMSIATTSAAALSLGTASLSNNSTIDAAISALDNAIKGVSTRRAQIGSIQNRLQVTASNITTYTTNLAAANSRIVDVDVAAETSRMARQQVLVQAGAAMLAQANQQPQIALSLLR
jgi:flagellin